MAHCYRCGAWIDPSKPHRRRKVPTGSAVSRSFPSGKVRASRDRTGPRIVCGRCAHLIDRKEGRIERLENAKLAAALVALVLIAAYLTLR